jgi:hypothetical protein
MLWPYGKCRYGQQISLPISQSRPPNSLQECLSLIITSSFSQSSVSLKETLFALPDTSIVKTFRSTVFPRNKEVFIMWPSNLSHYIFTTIMRKKNTWMDKTPIFINIILDLNNISKQQNTITSQLLQYACVNFQLEIGQRHVWVGGVDNPQLNYRRG